MTAGMAHSPAAVKTQSGNMSSSQEHNSSGPLIRRFRGSTVLLFLALLGIGISLYLDFHRTGTINQYQVDSSFCSWNETFDCDSVAASPYSQLFGVSFASLGALFYFILLGLAVLPTASSSMTERRYWNVILVLTVVALIPSAYLLLVSAFVLKKYCALCLSLDVLNLVLLGLALTHSRRARAESGQRITNAMFEGLGVIGVFAAAPSRPTEPYRIISLLSATALIFLFFALQLLPSFFVERIFRVEEERESQELMVDKSVEEWENGRFRALPLDLESNLTERDFARGPADATVEVVAYSDFECPFCKKFAASIEELLKHHRFRFIFKNFPLDQSCNSMIDKKFHEFACAAAKSVRCAGQQSVELFWKAHDGIFAAELVSEDLLKALPKEIGADTTQFESCMAGDEASAKIVSDVAEGERLQLQGTPAVFVDGKQIRYPTAEVLDAILTRAVEKGLP
ncbi:MAG: thioredoxin domain-containing protein [Deltaproteobacteria bacterium]|nr:thioredoxin domain-containing protein [Deltaproteobacteria bacterium]